MSEVKTVEPSSIDEALAAAGIPPARVGAQRVARLDQAERAFYLWILEEFATRGRPAVRSIQEEARRLGRDAASLFAVLVGEDLVHLGEDGEIAVAYPFSGSETRHQVSLNGRLVYAMCAIDALGIAQMFAQATEIRSSDPISDEDIVVQVAPGGTASWQPAEAIVVTGRACGGAAFRGCCHVLNFFASPGNAEQYLRERGDVRGHVISLPEAIAVGRSVFSNVFGKS